MVSLASNYSRWWRSFAVSVMSPSRSLSSNRMAAVILRSSAGSPTSIAPALLVTFVQNRYYLSSPRIPSRVSTVNDATRWPTSSIVRPAWFRTDSGMCSFERIIAFISLSGSSSLPSSNVHWSVAQLLHRASTCIVHLVWHTIRTPILRLSPDIFAGIYLLFGANTCDVDVSSFNTSQCFTQQPACRSLPDPTRRISKRYRLDYYSGQTRPTNK